MVSKSIPKSYRHMFGVEPKRDAINEAYGKPNEYQYAANNEVHENNSTSHTNSGRSSSNASDRFYEHDNGATSSSSSSANNHDIFGVGQIPLLNATSTPRPKWAVRKYLPSIEGVHHEIYDLYKWLKPTAEEIGCRRKVVNEIKSILLELWPDAAIIMFGSVATNSFLPSSDIDICVMPKEQLSLVDDLKRVAESIRKSQNFENVAVLDKTAIPIIKCAHNQTQLRLDIIFNLKYVGQTVQWVQKMMYEFPLLEPLLLILKQFLAQRYLNNPFDGGLPSYALITMLVCFFDEIRRRNLKDLQHLDVLQSKTVRGKRPLGFLFIYFLEMFIDFDYVNNGIDFFKREKNGKSYSRSCITSKHRLAEKYGKDVYSNGFWISDPVQKGNNLGKGAHNILAIKSAFCDAYAILHNALIQLAQYPEQIIEHYYYGPLTSLIINTEFNNRSANIESSRLILFGQLMEGKQQPNEEEAKNTSDEANLIEEHGTTVEDDSISTINDGDGIINNDDVVTKMKIE